MAHPGLVTMHLRLSIMLNENSSHARGSLEKHTATAAGTTTNQKRWWHSITAVTCMPVDAKFK